MSKLKNKSIIFTLAVLIVSSLIGSTVFIVKTNLLYKMFVKDGGLVEIVDISEFSDDYGKLNEFRDSIDAIKDLYRNEEVGSVNLNIPVSYSDDFDQIMDDIFGSVFKHFKNLKELNCVSWASGKFYYRESNGEWVIKYEVNDKSLNDYKKIKSYSNLLNSLVDDSMTKKEAVNVFNKYIVENKEYDYDLNDYSRTIESVFDSDKSLCAGFSKFMQLACYSVGVESEYVSGYVGSIENKHAWNRVLLDNSWYYIDTTWNLDSSFNDYGLSWKLWDDHHIN